MNNEDKKLIRNILSHLLMFFFGMWMFWFLFWVTPEHPKRFVGFYFWTPMAICWMLRNSIKEDNEESSKYYGR